MDNKRIIEILNTQIGEAAKDCWDEDYPDGNLPADGSHLLLPLGIRDVSDSDGLFYLISDTMKNWNRIKRLLGFDPVSKWDPAELSKSVGMSFLVDDDDNWLDVLQEVSGLPEERVIDNRGVIPHHYLGFWIRALEDKESGLKEHEEDTESSFHDFKSESVSMKVDHLIRDITDGKLVLDPPWQRGDVWTDAAKRKLSSSLLTGIPLPSVLIVEDPGSDNKEGNQYILDGKQRLSAIWNFRRGGSN